MCALPNNTSHALCTFTAVAGGIEEGAITLTPCMQYVDTWVAVSEQEIADAMVSLLHHHSKLVEGAAGCAVAACKQLGSSLSGKKVAVVCCGGNVALHVLQHALGEGVVW
jgi:threonine dehydratase